MAWLHTVIDVPARLHAPSASFWAGALGWPVGAAWAGHPELRSFEPVLGDAYVHLQQIDGAPRVHLDVESDDSRSTISAAVAAGAQPVTRSERWESLLSPGGLPFCVLKTRPRTAPDPVAWSDGHRSRLVQVCIDSPAKRHDDAGSPLQLLFQRLEEPDGPVRAHLDLGADDLGRGYGGWHVLRDLAGLAFCVTENAPDQTRRRDLA